jgi:hypothetical protein
MTGLAFVVGIASLLLLLGLRAGLALLAIPLVLIGLRTVVLGLRGRPLLRHGLIAPRSLGLALGVAPLADTAYVGALFSGIVAFIVTHRA